MYDDFEKKSHIDFENTMAASPLQNRDGPVRVGPRGRQSNMNPKSQNSFQIGIPNPENPGDFGFIADPLLDISLSPQSQMGFKGTQLEPQLL